VSIFTGLVRELVAGFTIIQVRSLEEAIEWVKRAPNLSSHGKAEVEIRRGDGRRGFR
jgi:hypothetical protein